MNKEQLQDYYLITDITESDIKYIESIVRNSRVYKKYIGYIRENYYNDDSLFKEYDQQDLKKELHHCISLYDLVFAVYCKQIMENENTTVFKIANEVCELHVNDLIPVCILAVNTHNLYHSGQYEIPKEEIHFGDYRHFLSIYGQYLKNTSIYTKYNILTPEELKGYINEKEENTSNKS